MNWITNILRQILIKFPSLRNLSFGKKKGQLEVFVEAKNLSILWLEKLIKQVTNIFFVNYAFQVWSILFPEKNLPKSCVSRQFSSRRIIPTNLWDKNKKLSWQASHKDACKEAAIKSYVSVWICFEIEHNSLIKLSGVYIDKKWGWTCSGRY